MQKMKNMTKVKILAKLYRKYQHEHELLMKNKSAEIYSLLAEIEKNTPDLMPKLLQFVERECGVKPRIGAPE